MNARRYALKAPAARYAGAIRTKRNTSILPTPSIRVPGFEDEDDDEDEYEAPHEWRPNERKNGVLLVAPVEPISGATQGTSFARMTQG